MVYDWILGDYGGIRAGYSLLSFCLTPPQKGYTLLSLMHNKKNKNIVIIVSFLP